MASVAAPVPDESGEPEVPFPLCEPLQVSSLRAPAAALIEILGPQLTPERRRRVAAVVHSRSYAVATVLEHLHDEGNIAAVMRSAEATGFPRMHLIPPPAGAPERANQRPPSRVTQGAEKWLDPTEWPDTDICLSALRRGGYTIWATSLALTSARLADVPLPPRLALVFGAEHAGVSDAAVAAADLTVRLPIYGFSQSYNVSVAAALVLHDLRRRRPGGLTRAQRRTLTASYYVRSLRNADGVVARALTSPPARP